MWDATSLSVAIGVLGTGLCSLGVLAARTYVQMDGILKGSKKIPLESMPQQLSTSMGGGLAPQMATTSVSSTPVDGVSLQRWSQRTDIGITSTDSMATTSCGLECVAYVIYAVKGVIVPASYERYLLGKVDQPGYTTADDLVRVLKMNHIGSHAVGTTWPNIRPECIRAIGLRRVPLLLGYWLTPDALHWVAGERTTEQGLWVMDPWFGKPRLLGWSEVQHLYANSYVHVDDVAQYNA